MKEKIERLRVVNELIRTIASCGRHFFEYQGDVAYLELGPRGRVWLHDEFTKKRIYTHYSGYWGGFTNGDTMRELIVYLRKYITAGRRPPELLFGPWPDWVCRGDLWGYGEDMQVVRDKALELGITRQEGKCYLVSVKHTTRKDKVVTLWRPDCKGYTWRIDDAGLYDPAEVAKMPHYYHNGDDTIAIRSESIGVLEEVVQPFLDTEPFPAIKNNAKNWKNIIALALPGMVNKPEPQYRGAPRSTT